MHQLVGKAGDVLRLARCKRVAPTQRRCGSPARVGDAGVLGASEGLVGAAQHAVQARMAQLGVHRFEQLHREGRLALAQRDLREPGDRRRTGVERLSASIGRLGFVQAPLFAPPFAAPEPGRNVAVVDGERGIDPLDGSVEIAALGEQQRREVGPAELAGVQGRGLKVGGKRRISESVHLVGHRQAAAHLGGGRCCSRRTEELFEPRSHRAIHAGERNGGGFLRSGRFGASTRPQQESGGASERCHAAIRPVRPARGCRVGYALAKACASLGGQSGLPPSRSIRAHLRRVSVPRLSLSQRSRVAETAARAGAVMR